MRKIVLYQYDEPNDLVMRDGKFIIERTTLTYDQKPDVDVTYAISTTLPKQQLVVANQPGKVYDLGEGLYRLWLDNFDDAAATVAFNNYISNLPKTEEEE